MKLSTPFTLASMAVLTSAAAVGSVRPKLDVNLEHVSGHNVKVHITNNGDSDLKLFNKGTIIDDDHVQKMHVFHGPSKVRFNGIRKYVSMKGNLEKSLTHLKKGESIDKIVNVASLHDLSQGGEHTLHSAGTIPFASGKGHKIKGVAEYNSNRLVVEVDGKAASKVPRPFAHKSKRATEQPDCTGSQQDAVTAALSSASQLAAKAASAARTNAAKIDEYFHGTDNSTRSIVSARLDAVSKNAATSDSGIVQFHCNQDVASSCSDNIVAYTLPPDNVVVACPIFYTLPPNPQQCHDESQSTTVIHEFTHADGVYSPGTADNGYGYDAATALSHDQAIMNADSYALFSNAIDLGC